MNFIKTFAILAIASSFWGAPAMSAARVRIPLEGSVTGLSGTLVLKSSSLGTVTLHRSGSFGFPDREFPGSHYAVHIQSEPAAGECVLKNAAGVLERSSHLIVTCAPKSAAKSSSKYTVGGTVQGLAGSLVLQDPTMGTLTVTANGSFTFATSVPSGTTFGVTIANNPPNQTCSAYNNHGSVGYANITIVQILCTAAPKYTLGGSVSGLNGTLALTDTSAGALSITKNGAFTLPTGLAAGSSYAVAVSAQPAGQTCTVSNAAGSVTNANVTSLAVSCAAAASYKVSGSISGVTGSMTVSGGALGTLSVSGNGSFVFPAALASGSSYSVNVASPPVGETCAVANGRGVLTSNINNVAITCTRLSYSIGGTVSGLSGSLVLLSSAGTVSLGGNGSFTFPTALQGGSAYTVSVSTQPLSQVCTIANGTGIVNAAVTNIAVSCLAKPKFTVGGSISGATGGLRVTDATAGSAAAAGNGSFVLPIPLTTGTAYAVSATAPSGQACTVLNGAGVVGTANVATILVTCSALPKYTVGGTISGLPAAALISLQDNGADALSVTGSGSFTFRTALATGSSYAVTVASAAPGVSCSTTAGSGTVASSNVTTVQVACTTAGWKFATGSSLVNATGVAGTAGSPAPANTPSARVNSATWSGAQGALWLFGGNGYDSSGNSGDLADLWSFNTLSGQWTLVSGSQSVDIAGSYGVRGTPAPANRPGARDSAATWTDAAGNLWLFGGTGFDQSTTDINVGDEGLLNDLWRFSTSSGQWTWIGGATVGGGTGVYGVKGQAAAGNTPGARFGATTWNDSAGNFWLFGGWGVDSRGSVNNLSDLWKFNPTTLTWTWVSGANTAMVAGTYGTRGVSGAMNYPGARSYGSGWLDAAGNLWLFGGTGYDSTGAMDNLNDLWKFNPASGLWTWMSGSNLVDAQGTYGALMVAAGGQSPGARFGSETWTDASGNLWLFFGYGLDGGGTGGDLNDAWKFTPATGQWTWMSGSNVADTAGSYGTSNAGPGSRDGAASWTDSSGKFWVFGGSGYDATDTWGELNDLWRFAPPTP